MTEDAPMIYGPDGITAARADEAPPQAVIFADLVPGHIQNSGIVHDEKRQAAPQPMLVAVNLPANCLMVEPDARLAAKGESYLMKLAHRAVEIMRGRGSVRMSVPEQINYAGALIQLFRYLTNQRVKETQLAREFTRLFEAHNEHVAKHEAEAKERESTFVDTVRQAYIDGIADECDVCGQSGDDFEAGIQRAADQYVKQVLHVEPKIAPLPDPPEVPFDRARGDKFVHEVLAPVEETPCANDE